MIASLWMVATHDRPISHGVANLRHVMTQPSCQAAFAQEWRLRVVRLFSAPGP
jgi:hypothetical protein